MKSTLKRLTNEQSGTLLSITNELIGFVMFFTKYILADKERRRRYVEVVDRLTQKSR